jgi:hypothetical protein
MSGLVRVALGAGLFVALAAGWVAVQRLWLRAAGEAGAGRDALAGRFDCGIGECGACREPCAARRRRDEKGGER